MILKKIKKLKENLNNRNINIRFIKINGSNIKINRKIIDIKINDALFIETELNSFITLDISNIIDFNIENLNIINPDIETLDLNIKLKELKW